MCLVVRNCNSTTSHTPIPIFWSPSLINQLMIKFNCSSLNIRSSKSRNSELSVSRHFVTKCCSIAAAKQQKRLVEFHCVVRLPLYDTAGKLIALHVKKMLLQPVHWFVSTSASPIGSFRLLDLLRQQTPSSL